MNDENVNLYSSIYLGEYEQVGEDLNTSEIVLYAIEEMESGSVGDERSCAYALWRDGGNNQVHRDLLRIVNQYATTDANAGYYITDGCVFWGGPWAISSPNGFLLITKYVAISPEGYLYGTGKNPEEALENAQNSWSEKWGGDADPMPEFTVKEDDTEYDL